MDASILTKACTYCRQDKQATTEFFRPHKGGKFNLSPRCRDCSIKLEAIARLDPESKAKQKAWRDANKSRIKEYNEQYRANGYKSTVHSWPWAKKKYAEDPLFNLKIRMRSAVRKMATGRVTGKIKPYGSSRYLPFTCEELKQHLESQFTKGMNWDVFLQGQIHIDHITPVASFDIKHAGDSEFMACWSLSNLRPLWASQNFQKSKTMEFLL
jgi:hypothetical protein